MPLIPLRCLVHTLWFSLARWFSRGRRQQDKDIVYGLMSGVDSLSTWNCCGKNYEWCWLAVCLCICLFVCSVPLSFAGLGPDLKGLWKALTFTRGSSSSTWSIYPTISTTLRECDFSPQKISICELVSQVNKSESGRQTGDFITCLTNWHCSIRARVRGCAWMIFQLVGLARVGGSWNMRIFRRMVKFND